MFKLKKLCLFTIPDLWALTGNEGRRKQRYVTRTNFLRSFPHLVSLFRILAVMYLYLYMWRLYFFTPKKWVEEKKSLLNNKAKPQLCEWYFSPIRNEKRCIRRERERERCKISQTKFSYSEYFFHDFSPLLHRRRILPFFTTFTLPTERVSIENGIEITTDGGDRMWLVSFSQ